jgi:hypothetical protein
VPSNLFIYLFIFVIGPSLQKKKGNYGGSSKNSLYLAFAVAP